ncbi:MAG: hypothetical protein JZD41_06120 [Thermoproteus sp.]|nr:hypothetical protein [Thermoproteus sp.]
MRAVEIRRGYVEWDLQTAEAEDFLYEVGVRAALVRRGVVTTKIAPVVRGVDVKAAEAPSRSKFNVLAYRDNIKLIKVNPREILTKEQIKIAKKYGKFIEIPISPLLKDLSALAAWLDVLDPDNTVFSTPVDGPWSVKSPLDVAALLVEISGDNEWRKPFEKGLEYLVEMVLEGDGRAEEEEISPN